MRQRGVFTIEHCSREADQWRSKWKIQVTYLMQLRDTPDPRDDDTSDYGCLDDDLVYLKPWPHRKPESAETTSAKSSRSW